MIGLPIRDGIVYSDHLHFGKPKGPVATQSLKLEASEQGGSKLQLRQGLKAPWTVTDMNPHLKTNETGFTYPQAMAVVKDTDVQAYFSDAS